MYTTAIFDMDGLLLDSERCLMDAWMAASQELGVPLSEEGYLYVVGRNSPESIAWLTRVLGGENIYRDVDRRVTELLGPESEVVFPLKPGVVDLLARLTAMRVPCAVASSTDHHEIHRRLVAVGVRHHFSAIAGSDEVARGKPDPAVYRLAAARVSAEPAACLAFEDSENGATAALRAGMNVVVVPDLRPLQVTGALAVLPSLAAAMPHLNAWFA
jgi:beta-phosphoglucomutase-like phosphatase (HAD superfamily)